MELDLEDMDLWKTVEDSVELLSQQATEKGLELICKIDGDVPTAVRGDAFRLRQILVNLVGNAVKFTDKGNVTIEVRLEPSGNDQSMVRFQVQDTGTGIAPDRMDRLFKLFSQADSSSMRKYGGAGLGLAISKRLVELMGGQIGAQSEALKGSTFWFTASFGNVANAIRQPVVKRIIPPGQSLRVLAVDDNPANRDVLNSLLTHWGFSVQTAAGGEEALNLLYFKSAAGLPFHLAILDMNMPGMSGLELAMAVKSSDKLQSTALILLTPLKDTSASQIKQCDFVATLTKPVRQSGLLNAVLSAFPSAAVSAGKNRPRSDQTPQGPQAFPRLLRADAKILLAEDNEVNQEVAPRNPHPAWRRVRHCGKR